MTKLLPEINEVVIVEGHSDTQNLARAVVADTIETGGSAVNASALERIKLAEKKRGVIILTDPDFNGQRIRELVTKVVPTAKQAFITQNQGRAAKDNPHQTLGVEHASSADLQAALAQLVTPKKSAMSDIDKAFLLQQGLLAGANARQRRQLVGDVLHIGYANGKQFLRRTQQFGITKLQILTVLKGND